MTYEPVTWIEKEAYAKVAIVWAWFEVYGWHALAGFVAFLFLLPAGSTIQS